MYQEPNPAVSPGLLMPVSGLGLAQSELLPLFICHFPLSAFALRLKMKADTKSRNSQVNWSHGDYCNATLRDRKAGILTTPHTMQFSHWESIRDPDHLGPELAHGPLSSRCLLVFPTPPSPSRSLGFLINPAPSHCLCTD